MITVRMKKAGPPPDSAWDVLQMDNLDSIIGVVLRLNYFPSKMPQLR